MFTFTWWPKVHLDLVKMSAIDRDEKKKRTKNNKKKKKKLNFLVCGNMWKLCMLFHKSFDSWILKIIQTLLRRLLMNPLTPQNYDFMLLFFNLLLVAPLEYCLKKMESFPRICSKDLMLFIPYPKRVFIQDFIIFLKKNVKKKWNLRCVKDPRQCKKDLLVSTIRIHRTFNIIFQT